MQKYTLSLIALALLSINFANAQSTSQDNIPAFHGCLYKTDNSDYSPEGGTSFCLFNTNEFVIAGFGAIKYGTYQIDNANKRVHLKFHNPKEIYVYSTYDPTTNGTRIQYQGKNSGYDNDIFIQFNNQNIRPMTDNCAYGNTYNSKQPTQILTLYLQDKNNKSNIRQFNFPLSQNQNRLYIRYIDKNEQLDDKYLTYHFKNNHHYFYNTYSKIENDVRYFFVDDKVAPYILDENISQQELEELPLVKRYATQPEGEQDIYFNRNFEHYRYEIDDTAYFLDKATNTYHLTNQKKFELLKEEMSGWGYSEQEFNDYIANLSKQELQDALESVNDTNFETPYQPIFWKYHYHTPTIVNLSKFPIILKINRYL